jgi:hypothetical protein
LCAFVVADVILLCSQIAQELNQVLGNLSAAAPTQQNGEARVINGDSTQAQQVCRTPIMGIPVKFSTDEQACVEQ